MPPAEPESLKRLIGRLTPEERAELDRLLRCGPVWEPLPGPQSMAYDSQADIIGYGGAAGGGKTDLACGLALTRHRVSAIFRREATQLSAVIDRLTALLGGRDGYNGAERIWRLPGRQIEFGSAPHPGDETRYQGRPKDLLVLDEAANFLESQARFLMGWVRTTVPGQKCTVLMTFNPPTSSEGQWIKNFFAPWIDPNAPDPAHPGELRWYAAVDGKDLPCAGPDPFLHNGETVRPLSRTFVPSRIADNPYLLETGYMATLQALPEPLRSQMLNGDFSAGAEDAPWQVVPSAWVEEAMARWQPKTAKGPMDAMGVDVARGGRDETVVARRHGAWIDALCAFPGAASPDGPSVAAQVIALRRDRAPVHIDVVGWGASPYDFLRQNGVQTVPVNGASKSFALAQGGIRFANRRAELWWTLRTALDPLASPPLALPPDPRLKADLTAPAWSLAPAGILIESKQDLLARLGRSPDRGDAVALAMIATPKADAAGKPVFAHGADFAPLPTLTP